MNAYPSYSRAEQVADNCIHVLGITGGLVGAVILSAMAMQQGDNLLTATIVVYGAGLIAMLSASALYNVTRPSPRKAVFQRLDHAAIFVMIAGSYTPFAMNGLGSVWGPPLIVFVWSVALLGAALKLWAPHLLRSGISTVLYLLMGWCGIVAFDPLFGSLPHNALALLAAGGVLYSLGAAFHHMQKLPFNNVIWHGFVLVAAVCHYGAILGGVVLTDRVN